MTPFKYDLTDCVDMKVTLAVHLQLQIRYPVL